MGKSQRELEKLVKNRYNHLLAAEILFLILYPLAIAWRTRFPLTFLLVLISLVPAIHAVASFKTFLVVTFLSVTAFMLQLLLSYGFIVEGAWEITLVILVFYGAFFLISTFALAKKISSRHVVTADTIKGGICVYFLIGMAWAMFHMIMLHVSSDSYDSIENATIDCIYYSFTTLTTLGYGDVTPKTPFSKFLSIFESLVGQLYLAIFVAQLIGLNIARRLDRIKSE